jgi:hypothetical protein
VLANGSRDGRPFAWEFAWAEVPGTSRYHLHVIRPGLTRALVDASELVGTSCRLDRGGVILDAFRLGWRWKVRAQVNGVWSDWSEERTFDVQPAGGPPKAEQP